MTPILKKSTGIKEVEKLDCSHKDLLLGLCYSLTLCETQGDIQEVVVYALKRAGININCNDYDNLTQLRTALSRKYHIKKGLHEV